MMIIGNINTTPGAVKASSFYIHTHGTPTPKHEREKWDSAAAAIMMLYCFTLGTRGSNSVFSAAFYTSRRLIHH